MYKIEKTEIEQILNLIEEHRQTFIAPGDDYWEDGFLPRCTYYRLLNANDEEPIGYFALDSENVLTRFYLKEKFRVHSGDIFRFVLDKMKISSALVETYDIGYLIMCLENAQEIKVFFTLYKQCKETVTFPGRDNLDTRLATPEDLYDVVAFGMASLDEPKEDWLTAYCREWIEKRGVYLFLERDKIIGVGELRIISRWNDVAYIGVIVSRDRRRQGLGRYIFSYLRTVANDMGLMAACSTEIANIASDKAIRSSGFCPCHRIFEVLF